MHCSDALRCYDSSVTLRVPPSLTREGLDTRSSVALVFHRNDIQKTIPITECAVGFPRCTVCKMR